MDMEIVFSLQWHSLWWLEQDVKFPSDLDSPLTQVSNTDSSSLNSSPSFRSRMSKTNILSLVAFDLNQVVSSAYIRLMDAVRDTDFQWL